MSRELLDHLTRRNAMKTIAAGGTVAIAGCAGGDDPDDEETPEDDHDHDDTPTPTEEEEDKPVDALARLVEIFDDQPMIDAQLEVSGENRDYTPRHVWKLRSRSVRTTLPRPF